MSQPAARQVRAQSSMVLTPSLIVTMAALGMASMLVSMSASPADAWYVAGLIIYPAVGAAIQLRLPGNGVGGAMLAVGVGFGLACVGLWLPPRVDSEVHGWVALLTDPGLAIALASLVVMLASFPEGRLVSTRRRWLVRTAGSLALVQVLAGSLDPTGTLDGPASPLGVASLGGWPARVEGGAMLVFTLLQVLALAELVVRSRGSIGDERLQFRWFMAGAAMALVTPLWGPGLALVLDVRTPVWGPLLMVALSAPPVAIGIAVTRYGLYGIDRLISRSVTYLAVTAAVVLTYVVVVTSVTRLVPTSSSVAVAAATLAAAAVFRPLLRRIQGWVDRRFDRSRYDALRTADQLAEQLRVEVEPNEAVAALVAAVQRTLQPTGVAVWTRGDR